MAPILIMKLLNTGLMRSVFLAANIAMLNRGVADD
jgi:hypothetical protein